MAYSAKKKYGAHMCHGGDCSHPSHMMAEGGVTETGYEKGINRGRKLEKGMSYAGAHQRGQVYAEPQSKEESEGYAKEQHKKTLSEMKSMPKPKLMAEGGEISKRDRALSAFHGHQSEGEPDVDGGNAQPLAEENVSHPESHDSSISHEVENQEGDEDEGAGGGNEFHPMVFKIVMGRAKGYSKGGAVANEHEESADEQLNEFDDLPKDDHLEAHQDGSEEHGDEEEDEDREEVVKKVLSSRSKKDRMPRPA